MIKTADIGIACNGNDCMSSVTLTDLDVESNDQGAQVFLEEPCFDEGSEWLEIEGGHFCKSCVEKGEPTRQGYGDFKAAK